MMFGKSKSVFGGCVLSACVFRSLGTKCVVFLSVVAAWFHHVPNEKSCLWEIHIIPIADIPILVLFLLG